MSDNFITELPEKFVQNASDVCGEPGRKWLDDLLQIIESIAGNWSLKVEKHFPNLSYNFVALCACADGSEAVLKIALPLNNPEIFNEAAFLKSADGKGAVKLFEVDKNRRAILLEKLTPGKHLKEVFRTDEAKTVEIAIEIMRRIHKPPPKNAEFLKLEDWFNNFFRKALKTKFPVDYLEKASRFFEELSSSPKFLIHGDLHHENILSAEREPFLAIDPKGIVGNIGYEIAVFLNNHLWWLTKDKNVREKLDKAVRQFSEAFAISPADLRKWACSQMILSAWWTFEDNGKNWRNELDFARFWEV